MPYNPYANFWLASDGRVYGSAKQLITDTSDPDYVAWTSAGNMASTWPMDIDGIQTNAALQEVLAPYETLFVDLVAYAADARWRRQTGGYSVAGVNYTSDRFSQANRQAAYIFGQNNPSYVFQWKPLGSRVFYALTQAQLNDVVMSESTLVQQCFACESSTVADINAGTITTRAQVDAAFAAISNVFP